MVTRTALPDTGWVTAPDGSLWRVTVDLCPGAISLADGPPSDAFRWVISTNTGRHEQGSGWFYQPTDCQADGRCRLASIWRQQGLIPDGQVAVIGPTGQVTFRARGRGWFE